MRNGWLERRAEVQEGPTRVETTGDRWGPYAEAVHQWEDILGRPAPAPTEVRFKGKPQLSARFVEWMMGLPAGWVTEVPRLTRNDALRALGNGVVPQQAAAALSVMASWEHSGQK